MLLIGAQPVIAQNYDPGSVILLKKNDNPRAVTGRRERDKAETNDQGLVDGRKAQELPKGVTIARPQSNQQGIVVNKNTQQNLKLDPKAEELTNAYASHLYTSVCSQEYRDTLAPKTEKNLDTKRMWADIQTSCKCLSGEILKAAPGIDLSDYVMYNYGSHAYPQNDPELTQYDRSGAGNNISNMITNTDLRQKCGFLK